VARGVRDSRALISSVEKPREREREREREGARVGRAEGEIEGKKFVPEEKMQSLRKTSF
jgi:hypothetical protein